MKIKKSIILLLLSYATLSLSAQNHFLGIKEGVSWSDVTTRNFFDNSNHRMGLVAGLSYDYLFEQSFTLGADVLYSPRGFSDIIILANSHGNILGYNSKILFYYDYLEVPLRVGFHYGKTLYCFANMGITPAILLNAQITVPDIVVEGEIVFLKEKHNVTKNVNRFDFGGIVEVGGGHKLTDGLWIYSSFSYQHSLTSITNRNHFYGSKIWHNAMTVSIGLKYALTQK